MQTAGISHLFSDYQKRLYIKGVIRWRQINAAGKQTLHRLKRILHAKHPPEEKRLPLEKRLQEADSRHLEGTHLLFRRIAEPLGCRYRITTNQSVMKLS